MSAEQISEIIVDNAPYEPLEMVGSEVIENPVPSVTLKPRLPTKAIKMTPNALGNLQADIDAWNAQPARVRARWADGAACNTVSRDVFDIPEQYEPEEAKRTCRGCAIAARCLVRSLAEEEPRGIWAGLNKRQRSGILKQLKDAQSS